MTPQERQLVEELFNRLSRLEDTPRDADAERLIVDGLKSAPHAVYALVQTVLIQDEALKRANAHIQEMQAQLGGEDRPPQPGFLDNMRDAVFGRRDTRGSVPSVRPPGGSPFSGAPGYQPGSAPQPGGPQPGYAPPPTAPGYAPQPPYGGGSAVGSGGSFLGTAASVAAGAIGGSLLLGGIRSMFGSHGGGSGASAFGGLGDQSSPWGGSSASGSSLARDAGIDDIGTASTGSSAGSDRAGLFDANDTADDRAGLFDSTDTADDSDYGGDSGGDSDYA